MTLSDPVPWSYVPPGAVVLIGGVPRTVLIGPGRNGDCAWLEGVIGPYWVGYEHLGERRDTVQLVVLGEAEALGHLHGAGLTTEIIEIKE